MQNKEELKRQLRWCSKHQVIHSIHTSYDSCRFPNKSKKRINLDSGNIETVYRKVDDYPYNRGFHD